MGSFKITAPTTIDMEVEIFPITEITTELKCFDIYPISIVDMSTQNTPKYAVAPMRDGRENP